MLGCQTLVVQFSSWVSASGKAKVVPESLLLSLCQVQQETHWPFGLSLPAVEEAFISGDKTDCFVPKSGPLSIVVAGTSITANNKRAVSCAVQYTECVHLLDAEDLQL